MVELAAAVGALIDVDGTSRSGRIATARTPNRSREGWRPQSGSWAYSRQRRGHRAARHEFDPVARAERDACCSQLTDPPRIEGFDVRRPLFPRVEKDIPGPRPAQRVRFGAPESAVVHELDQQAVRASKPSGFEPNTGSPILQPGGRDNLFASADLDSRQRGDGRDRYVIHPRKDTVDSPQEGVYRWQFR